MNKPPQDIEAKYPLLHRICEFFKFPRYSFTATVDHGMVLHGKFRSLRVKPDDKLITYITKQLSKHQLTVSKVTVELIK